MQANLERLRTALLSASNDVLRDALRRTLGVVLCVPTVDGKEHYLLAQFEGGDMPLMSWLAVQERSGAQAKLGLAALVAGAGFGPFLVSRNRGA